MHLPFVFRSFSGSTNEVATNEQKDRLSRNLGSRNHACRFKLRMFIMQVLASQLPFLATRNAKLVKTGGHVALLCGRTVYFLYCGLAKFSEKLATVFAMDVGPFLVKNIDKITVCPAARSNLNGLEPI